MSAEQPRGGFGGPDGLPGGFGEFVGHQTRVPLGELTGARTVGMSQALGAPYGISGEVPQDTLRRLEFEAGQLRAADVTNQPAQPDPDHLAFQAHPLYQAFFAAWQQATKGKGSRHGGDATPFYDQSWCHIAKAQGGGFLVGQAEKKLHEAGTRLQGVVTAGEQQPKHGDAAWEREVLGALVYSGMAILHARGLP